MELDRRNTNFPSLLKKIILDYDDSQLHKNLLYYQKWVLIAFRHNISKGILLRHTMGAGKTIASIAIADLALSGKVLINGKKLDKVYFIGPTSLEHNLNKGIEEYNQLTGSNLDPNKFIFIRKSYTAVKNISKYETAGDFKPVLNKQAEFIKNISVLENALVIMDEVHLIMQLISNGSEGMVSLYDMLMRSNNIKIVALTGTIINSKPFELVPLLNLLAGEVLFPENYELFMNLFWNKENKEMINKCKFQNRIFGLVSNIDSDVLDLKPGEHNSNSKSKKEDKTASKSEAALDFAEQNRIHKVNPKAASLVLAESNYPDLYDPIIVNVPMNPSQLAVYFARREEEIKEVQNRKNKIGSLNNSRFAKNDSNSSTYRVRTRQCSNYAPPIEVDALYDTKKYTEEDINNIMNNTTKEQRYSPKFNEINKIIKSHNQQKGVVYSQFTGIGGNGALSLYLESEGYIRFNYQDYLANKSKYFEDKKYKVFASLNGSVPEVEYNEILKLYNNVNPVQAGSLDNLRGETIFLLLVGTREAVGLDLKCGRYVIMMEPYWVYSLYIQLVHRIKRFKSHIALPLNERNCQPYILLATYPNDLDRNLITSKALEKTTDETIYQIMLENRDLIKPFEDAIYETAIECLLLQDYFPEKKCRLCAPNNSKLYSVVDKYNKDTNKLLHYDIIEPDPCQEYKTETIKVQKIEVTTDNGDKHELFYVKDSSTYSGYKVFIYNKHKGIHEEIFDNSPLFKLVLLKLGIKK